ncbi:hypothetical protein CAEBREN_04169 [Caenorhabditis brenneri]|uniref:DUF38 domain-containing protein n=1 Tax=Caenorhabditis brenneri TaxID=135651 RepID=G0P386_CAEBE|nr:hypothetical protein CAEBREN_04169 [Caenorhabditis brenneri]
MNSKLEEFRFRLRKVCRDLQFSIDEIKPDLHLLSVKLEIPISARLIGAYYDHKYKSQEEVFMKYGEPQIACILEWKQGDICKRLQIPIKEAENLLTNPKLILDCLNIDLLYTSDSPTGCSKMAARFTGTEADLKKFRESMKSLLKGHLLKTSKIRLHVHDLSEATDFLKFIDPKSLKTISIKNWHSRQATKMNFSELETLEQWENAEELEIKGNFILTPIGNFASFESVTLCLDTIRMEELNAVKEVCPCIQMSRRC